MDAVHMKSPSTIEHAPPLPARDTYRHGDLRRALISAGLALAAAGGPEAVVLREATRRAGVAPNAAYRHFASRQDLLAAVRQAAVAAMAESMEAQMQGLPPPAEPVAHARAMLRAVGAGYLAFARAQTGLFRTAFGGEFQRQTGDQAAKAGRSGLDPFEHLTRALDLLVEAGVLPAQRRPQAEFLAWSAVHGLALLVIDGPLRGHAPAQVDGLAQRLLDMVERGL
jgi:AcrR family transcriptional regulator